MNMKSITILLVVIMTSCCVSATTSMLRGEDSLSSLVNVTTGKDACGGQDYGTAGVFDFYVFEQSWSAEFCYKKTFPGCARPTQFMQSQLTIHGLWPNYAAAQQGHTWPQCCSSKYGPNIDPHVVQQYLNDLKTYWPNEQQPDPTPDYSATLWNHEWGKHGTCSGLDQSSYFKSAMKDVYPQVATPSIISQRVGSSVTKGDLKRAYSKLVKFQCSSGYLASVESCFNKNMGWIDCPAIGGSDTCGSDSNVIKIRKFGQ